MNRKKNERTAWQQLSSTKWKSGQKKRQKGKEEENQCSNELYQEPTAEKQEKLKPNLNSVKPMDCVKTYGLSKWHIEKLMAKNMLLTGIEMADQIQP